MTNEELRARNARRRIHQIAIVTRDIDAAMKKWVEILGIGPWSVFTFTDENVSGFEVFGKPVSEPFKVYTAVSQVGDLELEITQPVYGPTIYDDFLEKSGGEGIHHIKERIATDRIEDEAARYVDAGYPVIQTGWYETDVHFNLDTGEQLGFVYELGNCPKLELELTPDMYRVYPSESNGAAAPTAPSSPGDVVAAIVELFNAGELDRAAEMIGVDAVDHMALAGGAGGRVGWRERWDETKRTIPDIHLEILQQVEQGDLVCNRYTMRGTDTVGIDGAEPTNRAFEILVLDMVRVEDGQVQEHWALTDAAAMEAQLKGEDA